MDRNIQKESYCYSNRSFLRLTIAFTIAFVFHNYAFAKEPEKKITWYIFDIKPTHFISGPEKGTGYADYAQARLIKGMTDYEHAIRIVSIARLVADLKVGKKFCVVNGFYGGAPFPTAYSAPYDISSARHVITSYCVGIWNQHSQWAKFATSSQLLLLSQRSNNEADLTCHCCCL